MSDNDNLKKDIETFTADALKNWGIPGCAAAVFSGGELVSSRGYGVRTLGSVAAVDKDTVFAIGSCTKAFIAAGIGLLVDDSKLNFDDKVIEYLPDFSMYDTWVAEEVSIRDILCHRTALKRAIRLMQKDQVFNANDYYKRIKYIQPAAGFRSKFAYNNANYIIAGKIIEAVSGKKWGEFLEEHIFRPLGMSSTFSNYSSLASSMADNISSPHANLEGGFVPASLRMLDPVEPVNWTDYGENAAGSIVSTVHDMSLWLKMFLDKGIFNGKQILSKDVITELTNPQMLITPGDSDMGFMADVGIKSNFMSYGFGWYVGDYNGEKIIFHDGQIHGFSAAIAYMPEKKIGGVFLLNVYQTMVHPVMGFDIFDRVNGMVKENTYSQNALALIKGWRKHVEAGVSQLIDSRQKGTLPSLGIKEYAGVFESECFGVVAISVDETTGNLIYQYGDSKLNLAELEHWEGDTFIINYNYKIYDTEILTFNIGTEKVVESFLLKEVDVFVKKEN